MEEKPKGTFKCMACGEIWDGSKLVRDSRQTGEVYRCGDIFCDGAVYKISDLSKDEYLKQAKVDKS